MVGNDLQVNNCSGWLEMENSSKLRTENDRGGIWTENNCGGLQIRNLIVGSAAAKELQWLASIGENLWSCGLRAERTTVIGLD